MAPELIALCAAAKSILLSVTLGVLSIARAMRASGRIDIVLSIRDHHLRRVLRRAFLQPPHGRRRHRRKLDSGIRPTSPAPYAAVTTLRFDCGFDRRSTPIRLQFDRATTVRRLALQS